MEGSQMRVLFLVGLMMVGVPVFAQCPAGIPAGNNPLCIPPDNPSSPYYQPDSDAPNTPSVPAQKWADRWGAIAMDTARDSVGIGVAEMMTSERKAKSTAMQDCQKKGGKQCKVALSFYNQCGVLVWAESGYNTMRAGTVEQATKMGMEKCSSDGLKDCKVYYSSCSYPVRVR
ncbi:DUF4189 domain-containing protein [Lysobacter capsici]|uniref:DUF4189 domain-containing protein n=1 Tax=Lysobacter capsici TaxID=435897 RepID=UPI0009E23152|nr:DUF4189 domain-containing protein [Lysobacter capsici]